MNDGIAYRSWSELVAAFHAEEIYVNVNGVDQDQIEEFVEELNNEGIFFPSKRVGELPVNRFMYYHAVDGQMYTSAFGNLSCLKTRTRVSLDDCAKTISAVDEVDHECFNSLL